MFNTKFTFLSSDGYTFTDTFRDAFKNFDRVFDSAEHMIEEAANMIDNTFHKTTIRTKQTDNGFDVELAGVGKENIEVVDSNETIIIKWKDKNVSDEHEDSITLPVPNHSDTIADYSDGILHITFKPTDTTKGKKVKIK